MKPFGSKRKKICECCVAYSKQCKFKANKDRERKIVKKAIQKVLKEHKNVMYKKLKENGD